MTSETPTSARVRGVMSAVFGVDESAIQAEASADTLPQWDSVTHLQLMLALEDAFGVQFAADEMASLRSLLDIERRLGVHDAGD